MQPLLFEHAPIQYRSTAIKVLHFDIPPHTPCFRLHWHDRMELVRVKSGKLVVEIGLDRAEATAGELVVLPPKALHTGYTAEEAVDYDVLMFDVRSFYNETEICKTLLPAIFDGRAVFKPIVSHEDAIRCVDTIFQKNDRDSLEITALVYRLLYLLLEHGLTELRVQPKNAAVKEVLAYLEEHFGEEISIPSLCETFGYSPAYFCRKFKQATGLTPMMYLKIYRLEQARKRIKNQEATISEIALSCGFADANYFTRCFKAHFAVPPTQYRHR